MKLKLAEIEIKEIEKQINLLFKADESRNAGTIVAINNKNARIQGLSDVMPHEILKLPNGSYAIKLSLEKDLVEVLIMETCSNLTEGDEVKCTSYIFEVPIGRGFLGRVNA